MAEPRATRRRSPAPSHLDAEGAAHMVDVGDKPVTRRTAVAEARLSLSKATARQLRNGQIPKGDLLAAVRLSAIQAAKRTSELIPLCHALPLSQVEVEVRLRSGELFIAVTARAEARTGVEMEALTGASVAALTAYDMLKALDRSLRIEVVLRAKSGGRSGVYRRVG